MGDPIADGIARVGDSIDRLKTEQGKDLTAIRERLATVETLPRSIDELRREIHAVRKSAVTKEEMGTAIRLALAEARTRELESAKPQNGATKLRIEDKKSSREFWKAIIV